jgi:glutamate synthase (NADPH/NADH) large chain
MTGGCALILGATGRNLAAGMSGGVAYVYKLRADRVNRDALESDDITIADLDADDIERLHSLLSRHFIETDSAVAARVLANFETELPLFSRVLPSDYAAVLKIRKNATANNLDPDGDVVWKQILEVTGG